MPQCRGKSKRSGERCKNNASKGYNVCHMHGGKTPRGFASVHTTHGRYIKDVPERLYERFQDAINDPDMIDLKAEIALTESRTSEIIANIENERYGKFWDDVGDARNEIRDAMHSGVPGQLIAAYNLLDAVISDAQADQQTWDVLSKLVEQRRRLVESQHKLQTSADNLITVDQLMLSVVRIIGIIKEHVKDKKQLAAINLDIGEFVNAE